MTLFRPKLQKLIFMEFVKRLLIITMVNRRKTYFCIWEPTALTSAVFTVQAKSRNLFVFCLYKDDNHSLMMSLEEEPDDNHEQW